MRLEPGSPAPDATFGRGDGTGDVTLSRLWGEKPLVLAFLRHFG